ncbi:hypothetical protein, partial [Streptomyces virginiae]|uniref:hypothetical protein n=1 Tax=Streptomyces virginiae TaxID=1961 RepID=UPI001FECC114
MTEQQEASEDAVMTRIGQAVILLHAGDREEARNRLGEIWQEIGEEGDSLHRCTLAHYMADAQDDPADELAWDLRALTAADALRDGPGTGDDGPGNGRPPLREPRPAMRVFYPSLHLSLATDYLKLQRPGGAPGPLAPAPAGPAGPAGRGYRTRGRGALAR